MTRAPQLYTPQELTEAQKDMIKASVPILETSGVDLTAAFYKHMLSTYPEVKPYFNETNQVTLKQPKVLAFALLNYAKCIDDLTPLTDFVQQIVVKHVGLQIKAEHYPCVGNSLIATLKKLLGDKIATPEFLEAWAIAYGNLAQLLIDAEWNMYQKLPWEGFKYFTVTRLEDEAEDVKSVYMTPSDGSKIALPERGQYLGFRFEIPGSEIEKSREYSISQYPSEANNEYRISIRKLDNGVVSTYVHEHLKVGDKIKVAPPAGRFVYKPSDAKDILVFAGGIGMTPLVSVIEKALADGKNVKVYNSNRSEGTRPFGQWLESLKSNKTFELHDFLTDKNGVLKPEHFDQMGLSKDVDVYMIGPPEYMNFVKGQLASRGVVNIYSEFFGPTAV